MKSKDQIQDQYRLRLSLIISLLIHLSVVIYLLMHHDNTHILRQTPKKQEPFIKKPQEKDAEWVETKTRSSINTQATVFFQDDYNDTPTKEEQDTQEEPEQEKDIPVNHEKIEKTKETHATTIPKPQKKSAINKISSQKQTPSTMPYPPKKTSPIQKTNTQKQLPSLAQLTQGMLNYMQENGKHSVSMLGKKQGTPTDEQLKYERYLDRLNQCLHNSFVINSNKQPDCPLPDDSVTVYLALNKDATIRNLKLVKSCGNPQVDIFVMHVLQDASSSFPPVPHYLPHDPFAIHYVIGTKPVYR